jgi:membrane protease YdiL (CAAX protease family)
MRSVPIAQKLILSALFLVATTTFFIGDHLYSVSGWRRIVLTAIPTVLLLSLTLLIRKSKRFGRYWEVTFAFFSGSFGLFLAWSFGPWPIKVFGVSTNTPQGVAILKFSELLPVALGIIVLTKIFQGTLAPIYLQRGQLRKGLGLGSLLGLVILAVYLVLAWSNIDPTKAIPAIPWLLAFAIFNAFFEELLLRGLLLKRYIALLGTSWSIVLSALCYGLFFLGVQAAIGPIPYSALVAILPLGLLYGFLIQYSNSILGSVSVHAAIDLIFLLGVFAAA